MNWPRVRAALMLGPIAVDVLGNVLVSVGAALWEWNAGVLLRSWKGTLSATAWSVRAQRFFGWTHAVIDALPCFGKGHCEQQYEREQEYGSVWRAWLAEWRSA